jgi:hypothetical protein
MDKRITKMSDHSTAVFNIKDESAPAHFKSLSASNITSDKADTHRSNPRGETLLIQSAYDS